MLKPETKLKATHLLLDMQEHFAKGGGPLSMRDVGRMVGSTSSATSQYYVGILERWGAIRRGGVRTIVLAPPDPNYPYTEFRKDVRRLNT